MQIEISRVYFENHLPRQMATILIQKGNSINRDCLLDITRERGV